MSPMVYVNLKKEMLDELISIKAKDTSKMSESDKEKHFCEILAIKSTLDVLENVMRNKK